MKSFIRMASTVSAAAMILSSSAMAAISLEPGSLAIAFYETDASGTNTIGSTYVYDLGQANLYRDGSTTLSANIGADLSATFGGDWMNSGTVRWTIVGGNSGADPNINGDPARTSYISLANAGSGTSISNISSTNRGFLSTGIDTFFAGTDAATQITGANTSGSIITASQPNTIEDFMNGGTFFGQGIDPRQLFAAGDINGKEGSLDLYRVLHSTSGANPTGVVGQGQYVGNFTIDNLGNLNFVASVPEPSSALLIGVAGVACLTRRKRSLKLA
jgi:hypothetical protein